MSVSSLMKSRGSSNTKLQLIYENLSFYIDNHLCLSYIPNCCTGRRGRPDCWDWLSAAHELECGEEFRGSQERGSSSQTHVCSDLLSLLACLSLVLS